MVRLGKLKEREVNGAMRVEVQLQYYDGFAGDLQSGLFTEKNIKGLNIERSPKGNFTYIHLKTYDSKTLVYSGVMIEYINIIKEEQDEVYNTIR